MSETSEVDFSSSTNRLPKGANMLTNACGSDDAPKRETAWHAESARRVPLPAIHTQDSRAYDFRAIGGERETQPEGCGLHRA